MADRFLLRCDCGADLVVEPRSAGQFVACECGQQLKIPSLRALRELPRAEEEAVSAGEGGWSFRQGVFTCGLVIAAALAGVGGYFWANEPEPPRAYSPEVRTERFAQVVEELTPAQGFVIWWKQYHQLADNGFEPLDDSARKVQRRRYSRAKTLRLSLFGIAGLLGLGSLLGLACFAGDGASKG